MESLTAKFYQGSANGVRYDRKPDLCPLCHRGVDPEALNGYADKNKVGQSESLQLVFLCTWQNCHRLFIGYYRSGTDQFNNCQLVRTEPVRKQDHNFSKIIQNLSSDFIKIYNQSYQAEQSGLLDICGVGFRKSLEFLVKDYLISKLNSEADIIKSKNLGACIQDHVESEQVKQVAKRAVWLGNDETHYSRKWEGRDLQDLKNLIDLTVHWIEMEELLIKPK